MKAVKASAFKENCSTVVDEVAALGEAVLVTKGRKPLGVYGPAPAKKRFTLGENLGRMEILGDIVSPLPDLWKAWERKLKRRI